MSGKYQEDNQNQDDQLEQNQFNNPDSDQPEEVSESDQTIQLTEDLKRVQADFVNFKRSVDTQLAQAEQRGKLQATIKFLDIIDDIERALAHTPEELKDNQWVQGLEKVYTGLLKKMSELKLSKIDALGADFNPELHEAVMRGESESEKVTEVLKNGYAYEGVVVRHAMVKVG
ncbi:MAG: nucleotide exchange factor GrpE [Candidatus Saccharimonadales bacterium]